MPTWWERSLRFFDPFSWLHLAIVVSFGLVWTAAIAWARGRRTRPSTRRFEIGVGALGLMIWIVMVGRWLLPERFDPAYSLPLQLCDIAALLAALAFLTRRRPVVALLYFWGLSLSLQAVITPVLYQGMAHFEFWLFWTYHSFILATPCYFIAVRGFRSTWGDFRHAIAWSAVYLAVVLPLDIAFGFNYGFVGRDLPSFPTLLDHLGPWPARVLVIAALAVAVMALLQLPWVYISGRRNETRLT